MEKRLSKKSEKVIKEMMEQRLFEGVAMTREAKAILERIKGTRLEKVA